MVAAKGIVLIGTGHLAEELRRDLPALGFALRDSLVGFGDTVVYAEEAEPLWCEEQPKRAFELLAVRPWEMWRSAKEVDGRFVYVGSGCIWKGGVHGPEDDPSPRSLHGHVRVAAEHMLRTVGGDVAILRPRVLYSGSLHPQNALRKFLRFERLSTTRQSMTSTGTVARTIAALVEGKLRFGRTYCCYDRNDPSPFDVAVALAAGGLRPRPLPLSDAELSAMHPPRVNVILSDPEFEAAVERPDTTCEFMRASSILTSDPGSLPRGAV